MQRSFKDKTFKARTFRPIFGKEIAVKPTKPVWLELTGILTFTPPMPDKNFGKYVFQRTKAGLGNVPEDKSKRRQMRVWVKGTNPNTPAQQTFRAKFRAGVTTWHTLTTTQKETYRNQATKQGLNRFQLYMRIWMQTH